MSNAIANRYDVLAPLGEGGMGKVLAVRDRVTDREVALKLVHGNGHAALQQLKHEFWTMTRLRHPHTVEVYDYGALEDGTPYFTMEVISGQGLDETLPLPSERVRTVLSGLLRALAFIHAQGYVHGDLKPENVRVTTDGVVKIMDFGLMERAGRAGGPIRGTLFYLAPEVARGGQVDQRADLYSLGAVAYHLLAGHPPYQGETAIALIKAHLEAPVPPFDPDLTIDEDLARVITRLLAKDPLRRYQSAGEVLTALGFKAEEVGTTLLTASFVGRDEELAAFEICLQAGTGGAIAVTGPEGSGKSRLGQEFNLIAQLAGRAVSLVRCDEHGAPYGPIVEALRSLLPLAKTVCPDVLEAQAPVLARLLPELAEAPRAEALEPQQEKMRLQGAVFELLSAIAQARGLVLLVDDAQWLDEPSAELVGHLIRNSASTPLNVVLLGAEAPGEGATLLELGRLEAAAMTRMAASMLGTEALAPAFLHPLLEVSDGNPRYLNDLLHHLVESGMLVSVDGHWQTEGGFNLGALPRDLHAMLGQKLVALGPDAEAVAKAIALAAPTAFLPVLSAVCTLDDERLYQALAALEREGVVECVQERYRFIHHSLQALVLDGMSDDFKRALHGQIARSLEPQLADSPDDVGLLNAVTEHLLASDEPARAVPRALRAGERNLELFAHTTARGFLKAGLSHMDGSGDRPMRLRYLMALEDVERRLGAMGEAQVALEIAVPLCEELGETVLLSRALTSLGKVHQVKGDYEQAKAVLQRAGEVAEAADAPREQARALTTLGRIAYFGGAIEVTLDSYGRALTVSRERGIAVTLAESLAFLGYLFSSDPVRQEEGLRHLQESLAIKESIGDKLGLNDTTMLLGNAYLAMARYAEANECFQRCRQLNAEVGQRDEEIFSLLNLAIVSFETGDLIEAERLADSANQGAIATRSRFAEGMASSLLGITQLYQGQLGAGWSAVEHGIELAREMNNRYLEATVSVYRTEALLQLGRFKEAGQYAEAALAMASETGVREVIPPQETLRGLAQLWAGDRGGARATLTQAEQAALQANSRGVAARARWGLALVAAGQRDFGAAQRLAHESLQDADEIGAQMLAAQCHALLGELQLVQDRRSLASEHLRKGLNLTEAIGCPMLHGRILRLLAEVDPLRGQALKQMAKNESARLLSSLEYDQQADFEAAWLAPWVPRGQDRKQEGNLSDRVTRLQGDVADLLAFIHDHEARTADSWRTQERLEQLIQFAMRINQVHDLQLVLEMAMDLILEITRAERGFLLLYQGDSIEIGQLRNMAQGEDNSDWVISRSIADEVLKSEQPICLKDALSDERFKHSQSIQALHLRTVLCVPLKMRHVVVGALYVDRQTVDEAFDERDLDVVMSLAALAANAIENATLHREWQDKSRKLEMLNELSRTISTTLVMEEVLTLVVSLTLEVTQAERGFLFLWDQEVLQCRAALNRDGDVLDADAESISQSIAQRVLQSGESIAISDALSDEELQLQESIMALNLRTVMCVPLIAKNRILGLLYVDSQAIVHSFDDRDLKLLEAIANHASVAIENAHLYSQLARRAADLEEMVARYEEANLRASTDALTGLHNRRFFQDQLNRDFAQARRHRRHLAVIMLDIDHFKSFNDTYGHGMGDRVLTTVSTVVTQAVRLADVVARYGGEEFIVCLPDTDLEGAKVVAERIRRAVSEIVLTDAEGNALRQITVSLGVSALRLEDERIAELIERADRGLYVAKVKGRNQMQVADD